MPTSIGRVAVLGGYSVYGQQICHYLCKSRNVHRLLVAGQDVQKAAQAVHRLHSAKAQWAEADVISVANFRKFIYSDAPNIVVNIERDQPPEISKICVEMGVHYVDLTGCLNRREAFEGFNEELVEQCEKNDVLCITDASLNPGLTSAVISKLADGLKEVSSIEMYITPDEGLSQDVFKRVGLQGGFRRLTKRGNSFYGQLIPGPVNEDLSRVLNIPEIRCFYSFHSQPLNRALQVLSYFPGLDKDRIFQEIHSRTSLIERQEPSVEICLKGIEESGIEIERNWSSNSYPSLTPACLSSIPTVMLVEKLLSGNLPVQNKVSSCISLFAFDEVEPIFNSLEANIFTESRHQLSTIATWFDLTRGMMPTVTLE